MKLNKIVINGTVILASVSPVMRPTKLPNERKPIVSQSSLLFLVGACIAFSFSAITFSDSLEMIFPF